MLKALLNLIFPPRCEVCRHESPEALCASCFSQIKFMKPQMGLYSAAAYEGVTRSAIHRFKFNNRKALAQPLGILMIEYLSRVPDLNVKDFDSIVPVPLHRRRLRQRGFNQAELLAEVIGRYFEVPVEQAVERVKDTHAQFDLPREERFKNIKGAFKVVLPRSVYRKKIILLDDIYTTGSTMAELSRVLMAAGAREVKVLTLARAVDL